MTLPVDLLSGNVIDYYAKPNTGARIGEAIGKGAARFGDLVGQGIQRERERAFMQQRDRNRLAEQQALAKYKFDLDSEGRSLRQRLAKEEAAAKKVEREAKTKTDRDKQLVKALTRYSNNIITEEISNYGTDEQGRPREVFFDNSALTRDAEDIAKAFAGAFTFEDLQNMSRFEILNIQEEVLRPRIKKMLDLRQEEGKRKDLRARQKIKAMESGRQEKAAAKNDKDLLDRAARRVRGFTNELSKLERAIKLVRKSQRRDELISIMGSNTISGEYLKNPAYEAALVASNAQPIIMARKITQFLASKNSLEENRRVGSNLPIDDSANIYHFSIRNPDQLAEEAKKRSFYKVLASSVYRAVQRAQAGAKASKQDLNAQNFKKQNVGNFLTLIGLPGVGRLVPSNQTVGQFLEFYKPLAE